MSARRTATYRVQLRPGFGFAEAADAIPYLASLGVSTLYASPILQARRGSEHGYDVTDPTRLNEELGGAEGFEVLLRALRTHGLGLLVDIVPNHMAASHQNPWWWDVLKRGRASRYAGHFDIDWDAGGGRLVLPALGDEPDRVIERGELAIDRAGPEPALRYFDKRFPLAEGSAGGDEADVRGILQRQHYELAYWREGMRRLNYRRFFDINDLAALRAEVAPVFDESHRLVLDLAARGALEGVRVDHVDGLRDPAQYLERLAAALRERAPAPVTIHVEKILSPGESLPPEWPVEGTTGYEFAGAATRLFIDPAGFEALRAAAGARLGLPPFDEVLLRSKRQALEVLLEPDVSRLTAQLALLAGARGETAGEGQLREALLDLSASLGVYRTYMARGASEQDRRLLTAALDAAGKRTRCPDALASLGRLLLESGASRPPEAEFIARWEQLSGPAMAKGLEDTALYRYPVLLALSEVGSRPVLAGDAAGAFHDQCAETARRHPGTLLATSTHDTKLSEDSRARLAVLSEVAPLWTGSVARWFDRHGPLRAALPAGPAPIPLHEWMIYQAALAIWPLQGDPDGSTAQRLGDYLIKAARESKTATSWLDPDAAYEDACRAFVAGLFGPPGAEFRREMAAVVDAVALPGAVNSLAALVLKCAAPGVPDFYQGTELWHFALVDPDNRRPVDFAARASILSEVDRGRPDALSRALSTWRDGRIKLLLTQRALAWRRAHLGALASGSYVPLTARGPRAGHIVAFAREGSGGESVLAVAPRLSAPLAAPGEWPAGERVWGGTTLPLPHGAPGAWRNALDGRTLTARDSALDLGAVLAEAPVALLSPA